jgi:serine phosphatase RsbU (regulator of sigma subunit)
VALCYGRYDPAEGTLEVSNAGLPDPYLLRQGADPLPLSVPGPRLPLGLRRGVAYESLAVKLSVGDRVLFLTDGLPEAPTSGGEPLGYEALGHLLPADGDAPGRSLDDLLDRVRRATSETLEDDWTVLLLEHKGIAGALAS